MEFKDYYKTFEIPKSATAADIKESVPKTCQKIPRRL